MDMNKVIYRPIGIIHTGFRDKAEAPIQGVFAKDAKGEVEVFPEYMPMDSRTSRASRTSSLFTIFISLMAVIL